MHTYTSDGGVIFTGVRRTGSSEKSPRTRHSCSRRSTRGWFSHDPRRRAVATLTTSFLIALTTRRQIAVRHTHDPALRPEGGVRVCDMRGAMGGPGVPPRRYLFTVSTAPRPCVHTNRPVGALGRAAVYTRARTHTHTCPHTNAESISTRTRPRAPSAGRSNNNVPARPTPSRTPRTCPGTSWSPSLHPPTPPHPRSPLDRRGGNRLSLPRPRNYAGF